VTPVDRSRRSIGSGGHRRGGRGGAVRSGKPRRSAPPSGPSAPERPSRPRSQRRPRPRPDATVGAEERTGERLQKILAAAGLGSRRACEDLIRSGQVTINGQVATLGARADPAHDSIKVAGKRIRPPERPHRYLLLNKPRGFVTTVSDPEGRPTVLDLVPERMRRGLRPVGRLDFDTEGLLLLTDDGELGQRVSHPRFGCKKTYEVKVRGLPDEAALDRLRRGIPLEGRRTAPSEIHPRAGVRRRRIRVAPAAAETARPRPGDRRQGRARGGAPGGERRPAPGRTGAVSRARRGAPAGPEQATSSWWVVRLAEGRTRQIRDMFQRIGHPVQKLRRVAIGPVRDAKLPVGACRELTPGEVRRLRETAP
jgi:23S rRNA pseudouridine2605 synthase